MHIGFVFLDVGRGIRNFYRNRKGQIQEAAITQKTSLQASLQTAGEQAKPSKYKVQAVSWIDEIFFTTNKYA